MFQELLDDITDSVIQNSIVIMNGTDLPELNLACLSISFFNAILFDKGFSAMDVPRLTFIHLGMRP